MVRHRLDSINEFARQGYMLRIACLVCDHQVDAHPINLMTELHKRKLGMSIDALEARMKCQRCGWRGARVTPTEPTY